MSKYLRVFLLAMLAVVLIASVAMAGTTSVNNAGGGAADTFTLAQEALGAARNVVITNSSANNSAVRYTTSQAITSGNFISVYFNGAAFDGSQVYGCWNSATAANNVQIAVATPNGGSNTANLQISYDSTGGTNNILSGHSIYLTTHPGGCSGAANMGVRILPTTSASNPTITIGIVSSGNIQVDSFSSANLARITQEYIPAVAASNHTIDYLGTPGNGTRFVGNTGATNLIARSSAAINIVKADVHYGAVNAGIGAHNAGLTVGAKVTITDSLEWQGVSGVFLSASNTCADTAASNTVGTSTLTSSSVTLTVPSAAFNANNGSSNYAVCIIGNGNQLSIPRTITASPKVDVTGTGANDQSAMSPATIDTWDTNAYQAYMTWGVNSSAVPTYCLITNHDSSKTATILVNITGSESGQVIDGTLGTLAPKTAVLATLTNNSISLDGGTPLDITSLGANKRYSAKFTVTANPGNVTVACNQTDPGSGVKRNVPVLSNSVWQQ